MKASDLLKIIGEAEGLNVGDQVKFNDGTEYAGMVGAVVALHPERSTVDVMLGQSLRVDINPSDLELVSNPDNVGAPKGAAGESRRSLRQNKNGLKENVSVKSDNFGSTVSMSEIPIGFQIHASDSGTYLTATTGSHAMKSFPVPKGDREAQVAITEKIAQEIKGAVQAFEQTVMKAFDVHTREFKESEDDTDDTDLINHVKDTEGNKWKSSVSSWWMSGNYPSYLSGDEKARLQQLRNQKGPSWLQKQ